MSPRARRQAVPWAVPQPTSTIATETPRDQRGSTKHTSGVQQAVQTCTACTTAAAQAASKVQGRHVPGPRLCQGCRHAGLLPATNTASCTKPKGRRGQSACAGRPCACLARLPCPAQTRYIHPTRCQLPMVVHTLTLTRNGGCVVGACILAAQRFVTYHSMLTSCDAAVQGAQCTPPVLPACLPRRQSTRSFSTTRHSVAHALGTPALAHNAARLPSQWHKCSCTAQTGWLA